MHTEELQSIDKKGFLILSEAAYKKSKMIYQELIQNIDNEWFDPWQLWKDAWIVEVDRILNNMGIPEAKKKAAGELLVVKILKMLQADEWSMHVERVKDSWRYRRYLRVCFGTGMTSDTRAYFWQWIYDMAAKKPEIFHKLLQNYMDASLFLHFYLYLNSYPKENVWVHQIEKARAQYHRMEQEFIHGHGKHALTIRMWNPLYPEFRRRRFDPLKYQKILLVNRTDDIIIKETEIEEMIEELYMYLKETKERQEWLPSIFPAALAEKIRHRELPEFEEASMTKLEDGEKLHYLDHTVLYIGKRINDNVEFHEYRGTMMVTGKRVLFRGMDQLDIRLEQILRLIQYDAEPEIIEVITKERKYDFRVSDAGLVYQVMRLLMDKQYDSEFVVQKTVLDYEDLLAKADLETYIFAFKCMETYTLPDGWMEKLKSVTNKLTGLKNTIERYPEREDEIHRFLSYYIPEGIRIVHDFYIYQNSGVEDRIMDKMYEKITASMDTLDAALTKKMQEMYRLETISTIAKADALKQVMEQDGYINDKLQMKH